MSLTVILFSMLLSVLVLIGGALASWMILKVILRNLWQIELPPLPRISFEKSIFPIRIKKFSEQGIAEFEIFLELQRNGPGERKEKEDE